MRVEGNNVDNAPRTNSTPLHNVVIGVPDLVGIAEVADRLHRPKPTIKMWRGAGAMPDPDVQLACGPIWLWSRIEEWAQATGRITE